MFFDRCPTCGSESKVILDEVNSAIQAGEYTPGKRMCAMEIQQVIMDKKHMPKVLGIDVKRTAVVVRLDVCKGCGTMYCVNYEIGKVAISTMTKQPTKPIGNDIPFFGVG